MCLGVSRATVVGWAQGSASSLVTVDHLAQEKQDCHLLAGIQAAHAQLTDLPRAGDHRIQQRRTGLGEFDDDLALVTRIRRELHQLARFEPVDDAANGRLIDCSGLDQLGLGAGPMVAQGTQGNELDRGELRIAGVLLEDRRVPLVGLAQQVADLFGDIVGCGIRNGRLCRGFLIMG